MHKKKLYPPTVNHEIRNKTPINLPLTNPNICTLAFMCYLSLVTIVSTLERGK
jgi:hypothetical protein